MKKNHATILAIILITAIFSACQVGQAPQIRDLTTDTDTEASSAIDSQSTPQNPAVTDSQAKSTTDLSAPQEPTTDIDLQADILIPYNTQKFDELFGKQKFALFFHASWCPICRALEQTLLQNATDLQGATILKADYDSEKDLKKRFSVTTQSTVIFFDEQGKIAKQTLDPPLSDFHTYLK